MKPLNNEGVSFVELSKDERNILICLCIEKSNFYYNVIERGLSHIRTVENPGPGYIEQIKHGIELEKKEISRLHNIMKKMGEMNHEQAI